jgi:hypothetical protein
MVIFACMIKPLMLVHRRDFPPVGDRSHSWIAAGAEPDAHQFMSRFVYERGDRMEVNSDDIVSTPKLGQACMGK